MHFEKDIRYPMEITAEQLQEAPAWAHSLFHNYKHLLRRVGKLEERLLATLPPDDPLWQETIGVPREG